MNIIMQLTKEQLYGLKVIAIAVILILSIGSSWYIKAGMTNNFLIKGLTNNQCKWNIKSTTNQGYQVTSVKLIIIRHIQNHWLHPLSVCLLNILVNSIMLLAPNKSVEQLCLSFYTHTHAYKKPADWKVSLIIQSVLHKSVLLLEKYLGYCV